MLKVIDKKSSYKGDNLIQILILLSMLIIVMLKTAKYLSDGLFIALILPFVGINILLLIAKIIPWND